MINSTLPYLNIYHIESGRGLTVKQTPTINTEVDILMDDSYTSDGVIMSLEREEILKLRDFLNEVLEGE